MENGLQFVDKFILSCDVRPIMPDSLENNEFHFLEIDKDMTADEFLEKRLSYMLEHFSYDELSGLPVEDLNEQIGFYNDLIEDTRRQFMNPDSIYADKPVLAEWATGEEQDRYDPLTEEQNKQIRSVSNKISRNFAKAREDAQDRKANRLATLMGSIPVLSRLQSNK